ncbi:galanin receptor type 1-like [Stylophora pistillata]|uniref:galanin receptor type 1-like n=1 Tax=Stylophora pistillata TaxID=50429 RepID=UPI000C04FA26|nr:galanin receptor type 1-like [Stylophora pistillata]
MSNKTQAELTSSIEQNVTLGFYIAIIIIGLVGNSLVIAVISGKKSKRSIYDLFILNLGMADLSFIFFYMPVLIYQEYINSIYKTVYYCRLVQPLLTIFYFLSIFTISSMAIHRCKVITNPHKPKMKKRTGYLWIAAVWLSSFIIVLPLSIVKNSENEKCDEKWPSLDHRKAYTLALFILQFVIPLQIIAAAYLKIGIYLWRSAAPQSSLSSVKSKRVQRRKKENIQVIKTLALIVILFTVCLLPGQIGYLLWEFGDEEDQSTNGKCDEKWPTLNHRKAYTLALFILQFVIPLQIIAAAYLKIGIYLWRSAAPQSSLSSVKSKRVQRRKKENIQVIKTLALIVILFTVCLLPGQIGYLLWEFGDEEDQATIDIISKFATILDCLHACVNPIVYGLLTERFRREYIRHLSFCLSCGTREKTNVRENEDLECPDENVSPETNRKRTTNCKQVAETMPGQNEHDTKL